MAFTNAKLNEMKCLTCNFKMDDRTIILAFFLMSCD